MQKLKTAGEPHPEARCIPVRRTDFNHIPDIVKKDFAVTEIAGIENFWMTFIRSSTGTVHTTISILILGRSRGAYRVASEENGMSLLSAISEYVGDRNAGNSKFFQSILQFIEFTLVSENGDLGNFRSRSFSVYYGNCLIRRRKTGRRGGF